MTREQFSHLKALLAEYRRACIIRNDAKTIWFRAQKLSRRSRQRAAMMNRVNELSREAEKIWRSDQPRPCINEVSKYWIVELEKNTWIAPWSGDPGRTVVMDNARKFNSKRSAAFALGKARGFSPFPHAKITEVSICPTSQLVDMR